MREILNVNGAELVSHRFNAGLLDVITMRGPSAEVLVISEKDVVLSPECKEMVMSIRIDQIDELINALQQARKLLY